MEEGGHGGGERAGEGGADKHRAGYRDRSLSLSRAEQRRGEGAGRLKSPGTGFTLGSSTAKYCVTSSYTFKRDFARTSGPKLSHTGH